MSSRSAFVVAVAAVAVALGADPARAHALRMTVARSDGTIVVAVRYDGADHDGGAVTVTIANADKEIVATGTIGPDGTWTVPAPGVGTYTVVAEDDFGHRDERRIEIPTNPDAAPDRWKGSEPLLSRPAGIAVGIGAIAAFTAVGWWLAARKNRR